MGLRIPQPLADYYRTAGRAHDYNRVFERLLPLDELSVKSGKLVFMEENQAVVPVVLWGTDASARPTGDPPVFQATNAEPPAWEAVNDRCSTLLLAMLHVAATLGGAMPRAETAAVGEDRREPLDRGWSFVGEVNGLEGLQPPRQGGLLRQVG